MSQLQKLYQSIQTLRELSLPIPADLQAGIKEKEHEIINTEIVPALADCINAILEGIDRDIVLEARHLPGKPLSIRFLRWNERNPDGANRLEPAIPIIELPV
jgi:hypothetical protein